MALWTAQMSQQVRGGVEVAVEDDEGGQAYLSRSLMVAAEGQKERRREFRRVPSAPAGGAKTDSAVERTQCDRCDDV